MLITHLRLWRAAVFLAALGTGAAAQPSAVLDPAAANAGEFFGLTSVHTVHLIVAAADFQKMLPARGPDGGYSYTAVPATLEFQERRWGTVSVRYKGNSSYRFAPSELKRSLKIEFESSGTGRPFFGISELNFNNNAFDPTQVRETLAYDVFRVAGVSAPRTAFAQVFITVPGRYARQYVGVFTVVEQIDQKFFEDRWRHQVGLLLKPEGLAGMPSLGEKWAPYEGPYGSRMMPATGDASRFIAFVKLLNQASDEEFARRVGDYLDIDAFLRFLACQVLLVNTDSPLTMKHNFWITVHPATHKVIWLPWDLNMAFAGFQPSDADLSLHDPTVPGVFPLAERILASKDMVARYDRIVRDILATNFTVARLDRLIASTESAIAGAAALEQAAIVSKAPPLRPFVALRLQSVTEQLEGRRRGTPARAPITTQRAD